MNFVFSSFSEKNSVPVVLEYCRDWTLLYMWDTYSSQLVSWKVWRKKKGFFCHKKELHCSTYKFAVLNYGMLKRKKPVSHFFGYFHHTEWHWIIPAGETNDSTFFSHVFWAVFQTSWLNKNVHFHSDGLINKKSVFVFNWNWFGSHVTGREV